MSIRNRGLLALSVVLMAASGSLAYVLEHDAVGETPLLAVAGPGEDVTLKGTLQAFTPKASTSREAAAWTVVASQFDNFTYALETEDTTDVVLLTSPSAGPAPGTTVVTRASMLLRTTHPDGSGRTLVVLFAPDLESPILFR